MMWVIILQPTGIRYTENEWLGYTKHQGWAENVAFSPSPPPPLPPSLPPSLSPSLPLSLFICHWQKHFLGPSEKRKMSRLGNPKQHLHWKAKQIHTIQRDVSHKFQVLSRCTKLTIRHEILKYFRYRYLEHKHYKHRITNQHFYLQTDPRILPLKTWATYPHARMPNSTRAAGEFSPLPPCRKSLPGKQATQDLASPRNPPDDADKE